MTQALINTLNTLSEKKVNLTEKMSKNTGMDFGKIFERKTDDISKKVKEPTQNTSTIKTQVEEPKLTNNSNETIKNQNTKEYSTNNKSDENDDLKSQNMLLQGSVQESAKENTQSADENNFIADTELAAEEQIIEITEEEADTSEEITTITEEDPTMYNELTTLEDPTALLMLQSQIQQTLKTTVPDEQTEQAENLPSGGVTKGQNQNNNDNLAIFKQFDKIAAKDVNIVNTSPAEIVRAKAEPAKTSNVINENIIKELNVEVVSSQAAETESSMGDLMQNQSPQEQAARIMIQGDVKYEAAAAEAAKAVTQVKSTDVTPSKIIEQISKQLEGMFNNSKLNMVLNPGSLGKLNLQLINSKEGLMAQFTVTTQEARDVLMKGLEGLKESLLAHGVNVENVSVKLEENDGEQSDYTEQEGSHGGNKRQNAKKQKEDGKDFEEMMFNLENEENV